MWEEVQSTSQENSSKRAFMTPIVKSNIFNLKILAIFLQVKSNLLPQAVEERNHRMAIREHLNSMAVEEIISKWKYHRRKESCQLKWEAILKIAKHIPKGLKLRLRTSTSTQLLVRQRTATECRAWQLELTQTREEGLHQVTEWGCRV